MQKRFPEQNMIKLKLKKNICLSFHQAKLGHLTLRNIRTSKKSVNKRRKKENKPQ
jgi:hypothetical protein